MEFDGVWKVNLDIGHSLGVDIERVGDKVIVQCLNTKKEIVSTLYLTKLDGEEEQTEVEAKPSTTQDTNCVGNVYLQERQATQNTIDWTLEEFCKE